MHKYKQGEYIIVQLLPSNSRHIQGSLLLEQLNSHIILSELFENQLVQGFIDSEEDHGYSIKLFGDENLIGFLSKSDALKIQLQVGKTEIFQIAIIEEGMINLRILDGGLKKDILKSKDYNLYQNTDAKNLLFPGT